jgi:hypothetical protein
LCKRTGKQIRRRLNELRNKVARLSQMTAANFHPVFAGG